MWLSHEAVVVIIDYDIFRDAYITQGDAVADRPNTPIMNMFIGGKYELVFSDGPSGASSAAFHCMCSEILALVNMFFMEVLKRLL